MNKPYLRLALLIGIVFFFASCSTFQNNMDNSTQSDPMVESFIDPDILYKLMVAEFALKQEQYETALDYYMEVARETKNTQVAKHATRIAEHLQADDLALEAAQIWESSDPANFEAKQHIAIFLIRDNQIDEAMDHLEKLIKQSDEKRQGQIFMQLVAQLAREKNNDLVIKTMDNIKLRFANNPIAFFADANLSTRLDNFERALKSVDRALEIKPNWPDAIVLRARMLQSQKKNEEAVEYFEKAIQGVSDNISLRMAFARMLMDLKKMDKAREQYLELTKQNPDNADILYAVGLLSLQTKNYDDAEIHLTNLYNKREHIMEASYYLGQTAEYKKDYNKAMQWYKKVKVGDLYLNAQMRLATILVKQNKLKEALKQVRSIRSRGSQEQLQLYLLEGDIMLEGGQFQNAFEVYDRALTDMPENENLLYARAIAAEKINRIDILERDLRSILEQDPDNIQALNALGYTLADRTKRFDEALQYINRAFELNPKDAAIIDSMGWIQYRMGNLEKAVNYLRHALQLMDDGEIAAHLGEVLWVAGQKEEAIVVWNKALKESPENKMILEAMRRFGM